MSATNAIYFSKLFDVVAETFSSSPKGCHKLGRSAHILIYGVKLMNMIDLIRVSALRCELLEK